jgi:DNA-binding response OmpR family regulator
VATSPRWPGGLADLIPVFAGHKGAGARIEADGQPVPRAVLVRRSGLGAGEDEGKSRAVDVTIGRIRRKIDLPGLTSHILTIRGQGYRV